MTTTTTTVRYDYTPTKLSDLYASATNSYAFVIKEVTYLLEIDLMVY